MVSSVSVVHPCLTLGHGYLFLQLPPAIAADHLQLSSLEVIPSEYSFFTLVHTRVLSGSCFCSTGSEMETADSCFIVDTFHVLIQFLSLLWHRLRLLFLHHRLILFVSNLDSPLRNDSQLILFLYISASKYASPETNCSRRTVSKSQTRGCALL